MDGQQNLDIAREAAERATRLANEAADRASRLALEQAEQRTALAVARAVKDAQIDRDLREHTQHLQEINGSQQQMAASLENVERTLERQAVATKSISDYVTTRSSHSFKRWQIWTAVALAVAAYGSIAVALITGAGH